MKKIIIFLMVTGLLFCLIPVSRADYIPTDRDRIHTMPSSFMEYHTIEKAHAEQYASLYTPKESLASIKNKLKAHQILGDEEAQALVTLWDVPDTEIAQESRHTVEDLLSAFGDVTPENIHNQRDTLLNYWAVMKALVRSFAQEEDADILEQRKDLIAAEGNKAVFHLVFYGLNNWNPAVQDAAIEVFRRMSDGADRPRSSAFFYRRL